MHWCAAAPVWAAGCAPGEAAEAAEAAGARIKATIGHTQAREIYFDRGLDAGVEQRRRRVYKGSFLTGERKKRELKTVRSKLARS